MLIWIWYENEWREAPVQQVMHDTVVVTEPGTDIVALNVSRADISPNDLRLVELEKCRVLRDGGSEEGPSRWEWREVVWIGDESIVVRGNGRTNTISRTCIHPEDNRLMPPQAHS